MSPSPTSGVATGEGASPGLDTPRLADLGFVSLEAAQSQRRRVDLGEIVLKGTNLSVTPFDPAKAQENARGRLATILMTLLVALTLALVIVAVVLVRPFNTETLGLLISGLLGPIVGIVGTVVGFYFGQASRGIDGNR